MKHTHTLLNHLIYTRLFLFLHCVPISPDTLEKATTTTISDLVSYDDIKKAFDSQKCERGIDDRLSDHVILELRT